MPTLEYGMKENLRTVSLFPSAFPLIFAWSNNQTKKLLISWLNAIVTLLTMYIPILFYESSTIYTVHTMVVSNYL